MRVVQRWWSCYSLSFCVIAHISYRKHEAWQLHSQRFLHPLVTRLQCRPSLEDRQRQQCGSSVEGGPTSCLVITDGFVAAVALEAGPAHAVQTKFGYAVFRGTKQRGREEAKCRMEEPIWLELKEDP